MKTTIDHLLTPRFEVIADYPGSTWKLGSIINSDFAYLNHNDKGCPAQFPHLFKPLNWWEKRTEEEMPRYLKQSQYIDQNKNFVPDLYIRVNEHFKHKSGGWRDHSFEIFNSNDLDSNNSTYNGWEPCSEEEYLTVET